MTLARRLDSLTVRPMISPATGMLLAIWLVSAMVTLISPTKAATVEKSDTANCLLVIRGEIKPGDFDNFVLLSKAILPGNDGESTSKDLVCLDSPGGSLSEGVKFANHFYKEGVGTVVDDGQGCYSACAIMFMMGTAQGSEVAFANRKLHVGGKLGFHRPFLTIPSGDAVDSGLLAKAADSAYSSMLDLLVVANAKSPWSSDPMMKADLIQKMLTHIGDDMFMIDTVDKVGRWNIELIGAIEPKLLSAEQAFYACENSLQWQDGLTDDDITYSKVGIGSNDQPRAKPISTNDGAVAFEIEGLAAGYAAESCIVVATKSGGLAGCGYDETTSLRIGQGECTSVNFQDRTYGLQAISGFNPSTRIETLRANAIAIAADTGASRARCYVVKGASIIDDEPCQVVEIGDAEVKERRAAITHYLWPSGSKTVVVRFSDSYEINGAPAERHQQGKFDYCYRNSVTQNDFCVLAGPG
ncbi:hypothetical protein EOB36_20020 [Mesorhizobium sp. M6A.T.Cr.TU.017.01.1.1]|uniref:hypothetical protein n=1 Tax=Mesorhizobium sp. M6A.T.Cr.TU.017.01.1.1 TaxID=2496774 RepID=UPI000FD248FE|nr:hypothetical protein [Mesorhizobium sp. M6A.T.Cr.TU.017.01.1.1]RUU99565.1 hypothetical protein EOB36_20020 [Mesorhizobium sp. M6A.T.Cr.TU.017.01.1.1]